MGQMQNGKQGKPKSASPTCPTDGCTVRDLKKVFEQGIRTITAPWRGRNYSAATGG